MIAEWVRVNFEVTLDPADFRGVRDITGLEGFIKDQARNEAVSSISERANRVIKQIGDTEHYDVILADQPVIFFSNRVDITKKVIDALNAGK